MGEILMKANSFVELMRRVKIENGKSSGYRNVLFSERLTVTL